MPLADVEGLPSLKFFRSTSCLSMPAISPCSLSSCLRTDARYCGLGGCRFRLVLGVADNEDGAIRGGEVFVGPDFFWFLRLGRRGGVLRWGWRRRGAALLRLRGSGEGREKRQDHCE